MPTLTIPMTAVNVQAAKPVVAYGTPDRVPFTASSWLMVRAALSGIPTGATVSSAQVQVWQHVAAWAGTQQILAKVASKSWSTSTTWNTRPGVCWGRRVTDAVKRGGAVAVVDRRDHRRCSRGCQAPSPTTVLCCTRRRRGHNAAGSDRAVATAVLVVTYSQTAATPAGLHPSSGGIVSLAKPTLSFQVGADTTAVQVQVDASANASSPGFDSGEVALTAGVYNSLRRR